jgi:hypothetical protein
MTTGTGSAVQRRSDENVDVLTADFQRRAEPQFALKSMVAQFLAIPGLRAFWPMSSFDENGDAFDLSGQARTLGYNGNPTYDFDNLVPCIKLDGTGDYLDRADEAGLDILGTESYVATPGLTIGCWVNVREAGGAIATLMSKFLTTGNQRAYWLLKLATDEFQFTISDNGAGTDVVPATVDYEQNAWQFVVGRFTPSTELALFVDGTWYTNVAGIPASIFNSNADFNVGARNNGALNLIEGWFSMCFLSVVAVSDAIVNQLYEQSRVAFGRLT